MEFWMNKVSIGVPYLLQRKMIEDGLLRGKLNVDVGYIDSDFSIELMYPRVGDDCNKNWTKKLLIYV